MEEKLKLNLQQRQVQTLTPLQMQLVKVLEMNGPEIEEYVREVIDENPALEAVGDPEGMAEGYGESAEELQQADYRNEEEMPAGVLERGGARRGAMYETAATNRGDTLYEAIMQYLSEAGCDAREMLIGEYVAGNIDDNGYLMRRIDEIADDVAIHAGIEADEAEVRRVWHEIREMDPAGIGATDLRDCLLLQLKRMGDENKSVVLAREIVEHYFDVFSKMHFEKLASMLGVDDEAIAEAYDVVRGLNPKPGTVFSGASDADDRARHIVPDFNVCADSESGEITVSLANRLPELQIEKTFSDEATASLKGNQQAMAFVKQRREDAGNFIRVLEMRQQTLFNIMCAIVELQRAFFMSEDVRDLKPMILKDVAAKTGYDLSVISRATSGKYVATPRGVYPLKLFFSERPTEGSDASAHEILDSIEKIIDAENKQHPLSDAEIAEMLEEQGYGIARRTVTKYRERLGLPVARLRRGMK